jgi:hypothetical protein
MLDRYVVIADKNTFIKIGSEKKLKKTKGPIIRACIVC